jgi:hypothetical protein
VRLEARTDSNLLPTELCTISLRKILLVRFNIFIILKYKIKFYLDMSSVMKSLTAEEKADECISYALKLRSAWCLNNYSKFFRLYKSSPKMAGYIVDWFVERERKSALKNWIIKVYVFKYIVGRVKIVL